VIPAHGQNPQTLTRSVAVTSEPTGAVIWKKDGRNYTCANATTPAVIDLTFHGENDVKQILLRRFGYSSQKLVVDAAHDKATTKLVAWGAPFFTPAPDAIPEVRKLDASLKKEFELAFAGGNDPFLCSPFEFRSIGVVQSDARHQLELGVLLDLRLSAVSKDLNVARKAPGNPSDRLEKMARVELEGGVAEIVARFRAVVAGFPEIKGVFVACNYSTSEAVLHTSTSTESFVANVPDTPLTPSFQRNVTGMHLETGTMVVKTSELQDEAAQRTITFSIPLASIPIGGDKTLITAIVLAKGTVKDFGNDE